MKAVFPVSLRRRSFVVLGASLALLLSGCETLERSKNTFNSYRKAPGLEDAASGSRYEDFLVVSDRNKVSRAAWTAASSGDAHAEVHWSNKETGSRGTVMPGIVYLVGFNAGAEIEAPVRLDLRNPLDQVAGDYITNANTNVRLSPEVRGERAILLPEATRIQVIAMEPVNRWYLVAHRGKVVGYVFADLITKIQGGDLLLAGGDAAWPKLCRELTYKMDFKTGSHDEWLNGACRERRAGWSVIGGRALEAAG